MTIKIAVKNLYKLRKKFIAVILLIIIMPAISMANVISKDSSVSSEVESLVQRITRHAAINKNLKIHLRVNRIPISESELVKVEKKQGALEITYSESLNRALKERPSASIDILMLFSRALIEFSPLKSMKVLAKILATEGVSSKEIVYYSNLIKENGNDWLGDEELNDLIVLHKKLRLDFLKKYNSNVVKIKSNKSALELEEGLFDSGEEVSEPLVIPEGIISGSGSGRRSAPIVSSSEESVRGLSPENGSKKIEQANNSIVEVFYATNRKKQIETQAGELLLNIESDNKDPNEFYGGERDNDKKINYGKVLVNIPAIHKSGQIERPKRDYSLLFLKRKKEDVNLHIMLTEIEEFRSEAAFFKMLDLDKLNETQEKKTALVFVHGYNVSFAEASRVVAQLSFDSKFSGTPILFSWPSDGVLVKPTSYVSDMGDARAGGFMLAKFLDQLVRKGGYDEINLVAHSMGNLALTKALSQYHREYFDYSVLTKKPFSKMAMYAPDVDVELFSWEEKYIKEVVDHVSVYASHKDKAILFSASMRDAPRLGGYVEVFEQPQLIEATGCYRAGNMHITDGIDSIDATDENLGLFSPLNHSYFAEYDFIKDFSLLMNGVISPSKRGLQQENNYWGFYSCEE